MGELLLISFVGDGREVFLQFEVVVFKFIADVIDFCYMKQIFESAYFLESGLPFLPRLFPVVGKLLAIFFVVLVSLSVFVLMVVLMISVHECDSSFLLFVFYFLGFLGSIVGLFCFFLNWFFSGISDIYIFALSILSRPSFLPCWSFLDCFL
jgi:hypothetical protein